ncbi:MULTISPECIES: hypothetical protein [unclassified Undibacterium]|uniref:hypothetical protein n=1 Tax=unclassified Undibacterium TaxID=2630295 RepID=UPI002AC897A0|nr:MULTISPECIES: hypothetical protein [unclassified Undibacterium]MEB0140243.1 hypothetical protein [Undibacterium sp. CCC2.1]MEB0173274.1 hypothetical protein [Undibacterium sp. CCC1.1]MEB0177103.1 hypothetical protein [Undibacterium sp. CCC3.4]MEB0216382.1 hypothetical protein [Undibacterium sp. 5I2]WPX42992.1 hypothetical protein RHM61_16655 [Undibacterium sp. CCC3.4]
MKNLELILPFSIPPAGLAKDLLAACHADALARMLAGAAAPERRSYPEFAKALPHEYWLSNADSVESDAATAPACAHQLMQSLGITVPHGYWFVLQPVHLHVARDHLVLTDTRQLVLTDSQARALYASAERLCREVGQELLYGDAKTWFLRADAWSDLQTATSDAACGHNIDIWMPSGEAARAWRKLQNEIQMEWYIDEVNEQRAARGERTVNSLWLSGGSAALQPASRQLAQAENAASLLASADSLSVVLQDSLSSAALNGDWNQWLIEWEKLEQAWFLPLEQALKQGQLQQWRLVCSDARQIACFTIPARSWRRLWTSPSLRKLFFLGAA